MDGLGENANDLYETIDFIKNLISKKKYKNVYAIGSSAGGFAAILFGNLLNFTKVLAINPQTVLTEERELVIKDQMDLSAFDEFRKKQKNDDYLQRCLNLRNFKPFQTNVEIHYSGLSHKDKNYVEFIQHENIHAIEYKTCTHLLAYELRESGKLKEIILKFLETN